MKEIFLKYFKQYGINTETEDKKILDQLFADSRLKLLAGWYCLLPEVFCNEVYTLNNLLILKYSQAYKIIEHDIFLKHPVLLPYLANVRETVNRVNPRVEPVADIKSKVDALANVMWFDRFSFQLDTGICTGFSID